ncbi:EthD family reductase [Frankia gtarii]|uniref:EthD family reductase n=1 Tax=Frankia gtarii TaxID=2950102 RepID=UPI0021BE6E5B|nr:EthD family reductase [Frankia gtarii]
MVLYGPPTDPTHFREHYLTAHLPLVDRIPDLRGRRYSFDVAAATGDSPYFAAILRYPVR